MTDLLDANSRILPTQAINYTQYLNKEAFDAMFPGTVLKPGENPQIPGYYVVYQHQQLIYYFGPENSEIAAELYLEDLDKVVSLVQAKRASLHTATTTIQEFPSDPKTTKPQPPDANSPPQPPTTSDRKPAKPPMPWWRKVLKIIGL